ncbi:MULTISPECIES: hypothetical protein [Chitinophagaceae]
MKLLKKIALSVLIVLTLVLIGGYLYFNNKFSPPDNYLTVSNKAENIPIKWISDNDNANAALLLPVQIQGINKEFFMQLDFGSPTTLLYKNSLQSINDEFQKIISKNKTEISLSFNIKNLNISSSKFKLLDYGEIVDLNNPNAENIIGTIGTDLLEKRIIFLDFKHNLCAFSITANESGFSALQFKKRRILLPAKLENQDIKLLLLYDSGTSGYELITDEGTWEKLRIPNQKIKTEKGNSWGKELKVTSAPTNQKIVIANTYLTLSEVTHITGTSKIQHLLMKSSGMNGMIGNKIFLNHEITIDCKNEKFKIE